MKTFRLLSGAVPHRGKKGTTPMAAVIENQTPSQVKGELVDVAIRGPPYPHERTGGQRPICLIN